MIPKQSLSSEPQTIVLQCREVRPSPSIGPTGEREFYDRLDNVWRSTRDIILIDNTCSVPDQNSSVSDGVESPEIVRFVRPAILAMSPRVYECGDGGGVES